MQDPHVVAGASYGTQSPRPSTCFLAGTLSPAPQLPGLSALSEPHRQDLRPRLQSAGLRKSFLFEKADLPMLAALADLVGTRPPGH